jgi:CMP-N-acetylneuraminic acid synthetase
MIHNRKVTALIPIKEHSERVKNKNFRLFNGKPLYHHIIETLERTYAIDEIVINTDSYVVTNEAPHLFTKVKVIDRPKELKGDYVSVNKLIEHDLTKTESDIYLQTHATNPLLKAETIAHALKKFIDSEEEYDSMLSVNRYQSRFYNNQGKAINHNPEELIRTQDLSPVLEENSNFYIFTKESFRKKNRRIGENPYMFEMSRIEAIDIDDEFSFKLAEILALYADVHTTK